MLLPLNWIALKNAAKMHRAKPELEAMVKQLQAAAANTGRSVFTEQQIRQAEIYQRHGVKLSRTSLPPLVQAPFFIMMFLSMRRMAEQEPGFATGGALWFTDLASSDPFARLATMSALLMVTAIQVGMDGMVGAKDKSKPILFILRGAALASIPLTMWFPQALHMYWITNTTYSLIFTLVTRLPALRRRIGFPEDAFSTPAAAAKRKAVVIDEKQVSSRPQRVAAAVAPVAARPQK
jgi:YidC/Oxa1 family membrane protein insertase